MFNIIKSLKSIFGSKKHQVVPDKPDYNDMPCPHIKKDKPKVIDTTGLSFDKIKVEKDEIVVIRIKGDNYEKLYDLADECAKTIAQGGGPDVIIINDETELYVQKASKFKHLR